MIQLTLISGAQSFTWQPDVSVFLYSYIYRFLFKHVVSAYDEMKLDMNSELSNELFLNLECALEECIIDFYKEPDMKMRSKHPTRFENVFLKGKKYTVNYTTCPTGRMIYSVYSVCEFLKKEMNKNEFVTLKLMNMQS